MKTKQSKRDIISDKYSGLTALMGKNMNDDACMFISLSGGNYVTILGQNQADHVVKFLKKTIKFIEKNKGKITKTDWLQD